MALFTVITAYGDETGTHAGSPVQMLAGWVGRLGRWNSFDLEWEKAVRQSGLPGFFHATEHWNTGAGAKFSERTAHLPAKHLLFGYVVELDKDSYNRYYIGEKRPKKPQLDTMYSLCFRYLMAFLLVRLPTLVRTDDILLNIILEEGAAGSADAIRVIQQLRKQPETQDIVKMLGGVSFEPKEKWPGLQASEEGCRRSYRKPESGWRGGDKSVTHELGLLRRIAENLVTRPLPFGHVTDDVLRAEGLARARRTPDTLIGVLQPGYDAFSELCEKLISKSPKIERGTSFAKYQEELFGALLSDFLGRDRATITMTDLVALEQRLIDWFSSIAAERTIFLPCMISPWPSPRFSVGPVSFIHLDHVRMSEYYPAPGMEREVPVTGFDNVLADMGKERAHWLGIVSVKDCDDDKAQEVGALAVDLAIVAFQLAAPNLGTKNMSRLATRRGTPEKLNLTLSGGHYAGGWSRVEPGISIGEGLLADIVGTMAHLVIAVGNCIRSYTEDSYRLPTLERAWCDGAYWLHQGLVEPLDTIAVAKLETAIEVLFRSGSSSRTRKLIQSAMEAVYGLMPNDPITPTHRLTVRQFAEWVVTDRSCVLHGTRSTLHARLGDTRLALEHFAASLLRATAVGLDAYVRSTNATDDTEALLAWMKLHGQQLRTTAPGVDLEAWHRQLLASQPS